MRSFQTRSNGPLHRAALAVILAAVAVTTADATTLAIIRTPHEIVIAADSLMTLYGTRPQQACKIRRHGDVIFATAGLVESSAGVLDAHRIIAEVLRRNISWTEHVATIERRLQEPLLRVLRRMQREHPDQFREQLARGFALHLSLVAYRNGSPALEMREFYVEQPRSGPLTLRVSRVSCPAECTGATNVFGVGETDVMMRHVNTLQRFPPDLASLALDLVGLEIRQKPAYVGPPVDVVRVNRAGVDWVARKPSCAA